MLRYSWLLGNKQLTQLTPGKLKSPIVGGNGEGKPVDRGTATADTDTVDENENRGVEDGKEDDATPASNTDEDDEAGAESSQTEFIIGCCSSNVELPLIRRLNRTLCW